MYSSINALTLVYPPISNQVADWLSDVAEVREYVKHSKLYMIAQRHEVLFTNYTVTNDHIFQFGLRCGDTSKGNLSIDLSKLIENSLDTIEYEIGPQIFRIWSGNEEGKRDRLEYWATTDKILFDHSRRRIKIDGLSNTHDFSDFDLYYVGISKERDSFSRLFDEGHKNRLRILSNETQYEEGRRLTDEIFIFFFDVLDYGIKTLSIDDLDLPEPLEKKKLVADAEKAFIKILDCKYNEEKYKNYPKGGDGLYKSGLDRYCYLIDEDISLKTDIGEIIGAHGYLEGTARCHPSIIYIEGETVEIEASESI